MGVYVKPFAKLIESSVEKTVGKVGEGLGEFENNYIFHRNKRYLKKFGRDLGVFPEEKQESEIMTQLTERLIQEISKRQLTQKNVAYLCQSSRTRVNAVVNYRLQNISIALLIRMLSCLGVRIKIMME